MVCYLPHTSVFLQCTFSTELTTSLDYFLLPCSSWGSKPNCHYLNPI